MTAAHSFRSSILTATAMLVGSVAGMGADAAQLVDPTRPVNAPLAAPRVTRQDGLHVQGIIRDIAIINGRVVRAGDRISGVRIEEISGARIRYSRAGTEHVIDVARERLQIRETAMQAGIRP